MGGGESTRDHIRSLVVRKRRFACVAVRPFSAGGVDRPGLPRGVGRTERGVECKGSMPYTAGGSPSGSAGFASVAASSVVGASRAGLYVLPQELLSLRKPQFCGLRRNYFAAREGPERGEYERVRRDDLTVIKLVLRFSQWHVFRSGAPSTSWTGCPEASI